MADRMERVWSLVALLRHHPAPLTFAEIRQRLGSGHYPEGEAGRQRFEQDKALLRSEGIELLTDIPLGEEGRTTYRVDPASFLPVLDLDDEERLALEIAAAAVRFDRATWVRDAGWKLGGTAEEAPLTVTLERAGRLDELFDALRERAPLTFAYRAADDPGPRSRDVEPHGLLHREGYWYLVARDRGDGLVKNFRVDRIAGGVEAGPPGTVERPEATDLALALPAEPWLLGDEEPVEATVAVDPVFAGRVRVELGEHRVEPGAGGWVRASLEVRNRDALRSWVLGMREHAELLGPPELRDAMADWLRAVAAP